ncbi:MAG: TAXI family TRAP transporter solute-binding subunit, partial [Hyphomicrobiaceae bacterium]
MRQSNLQRIGLVGLLCYVMLASTMVKAQQVPSREKLNSGTVSIITGQPGYLSSRLASDLSAVLDEGDNLRILAIAGRGAISDLIDTLLLRGIDLAVVPADVLEYVEQKNLLPILKSRLRFVTRLYNKAAHLVAGSGIKSLEDLRGKKVNIVSNYHGSFVVAQNVFKNANINYVPVYLDQRLALARVRSGEIAATLIMSGRPNPLLDEIRDGGPLKFIDIPFSDALPKTYFPIELTSADYPDLILPGQTIKTIATPSIMMVYDFPENNPRRAKITRFIDAFLGRLQDLQRPPRHPRWRDVNLGAAIAGLQRYQTVAQWLLTNKPPKAVAQTRPKKGRRSVQDLFKAFIASESAKGGAEQLLRLEKPELFARFKAWQKAQRATP